MLGIPDYVNLVMKRRPSLKPNSAKTYAISLNTIAPQKSTTMEWMNDTDYILKSLERYKDTTKKNTLNALIVVVEKDGDAFKAYTTKRDQYNQAYSDLNKAHKKTAGQEKNWVDWPDYLKLVKQMEMDAKSLRGNLSKRERVKLQDYVITLLYSHYPLRNDFGEVKLITRTSFKKLPSDDTNNYLIVTPTKITFILQEYKTSGTYGPKEIDMNDVVSKTIRRWLKHNKSGWLLVDNAHPEQPIGSNGITKSLARIGLHHLKRRLGSSLLRHSYLSHKYADVTEEKQKDADLMLHSVAMAEGYIKK